MKDEDNLGVSEREEHLDFLQMVEWVGRIRVGWSDPDPSGLVGFESEVVADPSGL